MRAFIVIIAVLLATATTMTGETGTDNANPKKAPTEKAPKETRVCYNEVERLCNLKDNKPNPNTVADPSACNATYGAVYHLSKPLSAYANKHIIRSFEYLLLSTHFGNYEMNRPGFEKLFRQLSDDKWQSSIELIKHLTKRGGKMEFETPSSIDQAKVYDQYEFQGLAMSLDMEKDLAKDAFDIHKKASEMHGHAHDPEIAHYLEEEFIEGHADTIRNLAGHISDLEQLLRGNDKDLSLFLFDEYLHEKL